MNRTRRDAHWARLAWAATAALAVVVLASAWLRLAPPGPPCGQWPTCRSADAPTAKVAVAARGPRLEAPRALHRVAASGALVLVLGLVVLAIAPRPRRWAEGRVALVLLGLALGLAVLGVVAGASRAMTVVLANLLGGLCMLALAWGLARASTGTSRAPLPGARASAALWLAQGALGAASGLGGAFPAAMLHLLLAPVAAFVATAVAASARRASRAREGNALLIVVTMQVILGMAAAQLAASAPLVHLHNALAASGLALLWGLSLRVGGAR